MISLFWKTGTTISLREAADDDGALLFPGGTAHATSVGDARAGERTLERPQYQLVTDNAVEAGPPETEGLMQHGCHVRHVGDDIDVRVDDCLHLREECGVFFLFSHNFVCSYSLGIAKASFFSALAHSSNL